MFEDLPKIMRESLEGSLTDEQLQNFKDNPEWMAGLRMTGEILKKDLEILKDITEEKDVPWDVRCAALTRILHYTLTQKRVETKEKQAMVEAIIFQLLIQYPKEKMEKMLRRVVKLTKNWLKDAGNFMNQSILGTEIIKDVLGEGENEVTDWRITDKEIEELIKIIKVGKIVTAKIHKQKPFRKMRKQLESWPLVELLQEDKDKFIGVLSLFPDTMVKKIEEAQKAPSFLLKFAKRWKEENSR